jgi:hypothetical protein
MVLVAYSDRLNPVDHPVLACAGIVFPFFLLFNMLLLVTWLCMKWRKMWMPLMGFVLAYPSIRIYMPLHLHQEPPEGSIKVVSYNVASFYYDKKNQDAHKNIFDYLCRQKPDIVCLQEDVNMKKEYQDSLLHLLPYYDTIHINRPSSPLINALGVRSRYPIIGKEVAEAIYYARRIRPSGERERDLEEAQRTPRSTAERKQGELLVYRATGRSWNWGGGRRTTLSRHQQRETDGQFSAGDGKPG